MMHPKPTRLKILQGNPGKRPLNKSEPEPPPVLKIAPPRHLSAEAKKEYKRVAKLLTPMGVLTKADLQAVEIYAETYGIWLEATQEVHKSGLVVEAGNGYPGQNPYLRIANDAAKRLQSMLTEFGMTPSSRSRITVSKKESNEFDDL